MRTVESLTVITVVNATSAYYHCSYSVNSPDRRYGIIAGQANYIFHWPMLKLWIWAILLPYAVIAYLHMKTTTYQALEGTVHDAALHKDFVHKTYRIDLKINWSGIMSRRPAIATYPSVLSLYFWVPHAATMAGALLETFWSNHRDASTLRNSSSLAFALLRSML